MIIKFGESISNIKLENPESCLPLLNEQILEDFKKTEVWRVLEELEKFSADNFYKEIDALAKSVQKDTDGVLQRNIMNFFTHIC